MKAPWVPPKGDNFKGKNLDFAFLANAEDDKA
jgi:hypothetical protein